MNLFRFLCPTCGGMYNDVVENGLTKLLHRGLKSTKDKAPLPFIDCIPYHDYVVFSPCGHCCPEVFDSCRACKLEYPGKIDQPCHPTEKDCHCHYCLENDVGKSFYNISNDAAQKLLKEKRKNGEYDVFLCYNHEDKEEVRSIRERLKSKGLLPWLDDWDLTPGLSWLVGVLDALKEIRSAAIFLGPKGISDSQMLEVGIVVKIFEQRGCPVIPSILSKCREDPSLPPSLADRTWVDFRENDPDPFKRLFDGINSKIVR